MHLLKTHRFLPLFLTQFLGAFNDNLFKNALALWIIYRLADSGGEAQVMVTLAAALFIAPYMFFSATAGQIADKYDRAMLSRRIKLAEIVIICAAAVGFYTHSLYFLLFVLFCLGTQATFFGPIKYALLPQHLHEDELIAGNAWIEAGTFLAILTGTISGGLLVLQEEGIHLISAAMIACALGGYAASRHIPQAACGEPGLKINWNIAQESWRIVQHDRQTPRIFRCILGISWFWLVGATFLSQFPAFAKDILHADETVVTLFLTLFSIGVGIGSFLCNALLKGKVSTAFVPVAALGISVFTIDLFFASGAPAGAALIDVWEFLRHGANWRIVVDLLGVSVCAGLYIVPLYATLQHDSDPSTRARTIASNNIVNALFMVAAAIGTVMMLKADFSIPQVFLTMGILNGAVSYLTLSLRERVG